MRKQAADADILQAYPTGGVIGNTSKETTAIEVCTIDGVTEEARRRGGINMTGGMTNAIEVCNDLFNLPCLEILKTAFLKHLEEELSNARNVN